MKTRKIGGRCCQYEKANSAFCRAPHNTVTQNPALLALDGANQSEINGVVAGVRVVPENDYVTQTVKNDQTPVRVYLDIHVYKHIDEININCKDSVKLKQLIRDNIDHAIFFRINPDPTQWPRAILINDNKNFNLFRAVNFDDGVYGIALNVTRIRMIRLELQSKWVIFRGVLEDTPGVGKTLTIKTLIPSNSDLVDVVAGNDRDLHTGYTNNISKFTPGDVNANGIYEIDRRYTYNNNEHKLNNCLKEYISRLQPIPVSPIFYTDYMHYTFFKKPVEEKCEALRKLIATVFAQNNPPIQRGIKAVAEFLSSFANAEDRLDTIYNNIRNLCINPATGVCHNPTLLEISRESEILLAPLLYNDDMKAILGDIVLFEGTLCRVTLLDNDTLHIDSDPLNKFPAPPPKTDTNVAYNRVTLFNDFKQGDTIYHRNKVVITSVEHDEITYTEPLPGGAGHGQVRVNKNTCRAYDTINTFYIYKCRQFISRFRTDANENIEELRRLQTSAVEYIAYINKNRRDFDEEIDKIRDLTGTDPETIRRQQVATQATQDVTASHAAADASAAAVQTAVTAVAPAAAPAVAAAAAVAVAPDDAAVAANIEAIIGIIHGYVTNLETEITNIPFEGGYVPAYDAPLNAITTNIPAYTANITGFIRVFTENNKSLEIYADKIREQLSIIKRKVEGTDEKIFNAIKDVMETNSRLRHNVKKFKKEHLNAGLTDLQLASLNTAIKKFKTALSPSAINDIINEINKYIKDQKNYIVTKKGGTRRRNKRTRRRRTLKFR